MTKNSQISNYIFYLNYLNRKLESFFEHQSPYIFCKKGCSKCCQNGEYPFSKMEFDYIMTGFLKLPVDTQEKIKNKIKKITDNKTKCDGVFTYECPFLINNECSVYNYRGIVCRSFGLLAISENKDSKIPFCALKNRNYSNVIDKETKIISSKKYAKLGNVNEPLAFNVSYEFLTSENIQKNFDIEFGEKKALIDWFQTYH